MNQSSPRQLHVDTPRRPHPTPGQAPLPVTGPAGVDGLGAAQLRDSGPQYAAAPQQDAADHHLCRHHPNLSPLTPPGRAVERVTPTCHGDRAPAGWTLPPAGWRAPPDAADARASAADT